MPRPLLALIPIGFVSVGTTGAAEPDLPLSSSEVRTEVEAVIERMSAMFTDRTGPKAIELFDRADPAPQYLAEEESDWLIGWDALEWYFNTPERNAAVQAMDMTPSNIRVRSLSPDLALATWDIFAEMKFRRGPPLGGKAAGQCDPAPHCGGLEVHLLRRSTEIGDGLHARAVREHGLARVQEPVPAECAGVAARRPLKRGSGQVFGHGSFPLLDHRPRCIRLFVGHDDAHQRADRQFARRALQELSQHVTGYPELAEHVADEVRLEPERALVYRLHADL
jgi:hypothetical protein